MKQGQLLSCDVAIIGGGPAGAVAALTLARLGRSVVILESSVGNRQRVGETLAPSIQPILQTLGLWQAFVQLDSVPSFGTRSAWGGSEVQSQSFVFSPFGNGWHVDRSRFDGMLLDAARDQGTKVVLGVHVNSIDRVGSGWRIGSFFRNGQRASVREAKHSRLETEIAAKAVIDAAGRSSAIPTRLGGHRDVADRLVGIATRYFSEGQSRDVSRRVSGSSHRAGAFTLIESHRQGWMYTAPLPNHEMIAIEMTDSDLLENFAQDLLSTWNNRLAVSQHTQQRLEGWRMIKKPFIVSAKSHRVRRSHFDDPWLSAGDAAMAADPLSASGLKRAIQTGQASAVAMDRWLAGDSREAQRYEAQLDGEFTSYLELRSSYYSMERRWCDSPFWSRRQAGHLVATGSMGPLSGSTKKPAMLGPNLR